MRFGIGFSPRHWPACQLDIIWMVQHRFVLSAAGSRHKFILKTQSALGKEKQFALMASWYDKIKIDNKLYMMLRAFMLACYSDYNNSSVNSVNNGSNQTKKLKKKPQLPTNCNIQTFFFFIWRLNAEVTLHVLTSLRSYGSPVMPNLQNGRAQSLPLGLLRVVTETEDLSEQLGNPDKTTDIH